MTDSNILQLHRCVRPLDYPARHIVIGPGAMPYGPRSRSKLSHFVATLRASIAIASDALNSPFGFGVYVGFVGGCFFTVAAAFVWSFFL